MIDDDIHTQPAAVDALPAAAPQPPLLIGLCGAAGAGKDTVADYLCMQYAFQGVAMAEPIYAMLAALFHDAGVASAWMTERSLKELPTSLGYSYRQLAQSLGTEWGRRTLDDDIWVRIAAEKVRAGLTLSHDSMVVTDIRFPNEAQMIRQLGGHLVRVLRDGCEPVRSHVSEAGAATLPATFELHNHGSKATLYEQVDRLMLQLREGA